MRLLLAEDERGLSDALSDLLKKNKYEVDCAYDGEEAVEYALTGIYDVIILDVLMPVMNGKEALKIIRNRGIGTPVLMLTALTSGDDVVEGLDIGADDYMGKPFSMAELLARLRALIRRKGDSISGNVLTFDSVTLNLSTYELQSADKAVKLSGKEFELMRIFMERPKFVHGRDELINRAWGLDNYFESNNLEVYISFLRKKLQYVDSPFTIATLRGVGYELRRI
ncbi:MAG: response regulator transcription factor [Christensenellales bacterium]